jgi:hypothetical protein
MAARNLLFVQQGALLTYPAYHPLEGTTRLRGHAAEYDHFPSPLLTWASITSNERT